MNSARTIEEIGRGPNIMYTSNPQAHERTPPGLPPSIHAMVNCTMDGGSKRHRCRSSGTVFSSSCRGKAQPESALNCIAVIPTKSFSEPFFLRGGKPDLVKAVLFTDFLYFHKGGLNPHDTVTEPMLKNLLFTDGELWTLLRQRMTPAFTTGKLKAMFPLIVERAEKVQDLANNAAKTGATVDVRELMAKYTTDFIGACGFGIAMMSLNDETSSFRKLGRRLFHHDYRDDLVIMSKQVFTEKFNHLDLSMPEIQQITLHLIHSLMKQRNYMPFSKNDFNDLLLVLKENGKLIGELLEKMNPDGFQKIAEIEFDDLLIATQILAIFAAGIDTSLSVSSYILHQLAFLPEIQAKIQEEIDEVLFRYSNKLCYDAVKEMKCLEMSLLKGMRLFYSLGFLVRKSARKYTFSSTDVTMDPGVRAMIPLQALHKDKKYFKKPEKFVSERFSPSQVNDNKKRVFLTLKEGPRACIGEHLGLMQSLAGLAALLHKYSVELAPSSVRHPVSDPSAIITQNIKGGLPLLIKTRV
ncbi:Cytochrome P450 6a2 [Eumeta japonica]|uniref:unspecific monooxygenase n=1 Tax=Eumeta variegata TaxID=151549 RepID=A0A4C1XC90_EUMVA|nr:Cytochrome P450 6a2 [Eumeta japonica]